MYELNKKDVLEDFRRFLRVEKGLSPKTVSEHTYMAEKYIDFCEKIIPDIDKAKDLKEEMMNEDYSESHINNTMKAIKYYYKMHDVEFDFNRLNRPKKLPEPLTEKEVKRMLYACKNYRDYAIIKTLASSGIRASELCNLDIKDIDLEKRKLKVVQGKGSKDGIVVFSRE